MKNTSILLLVGAVIVIAAIGYSATRKAPTSDTIAPGDAAMEETRPADDVMVGEGTVPEDDSMIGGDAAKPEDADAPKDDVVVDVDTSVSVDTSPKAVTIDVAGVNFAFDKEVIRVKEGQTVTINFTSTNGFHDWVLDEFSAASAKVQTGGKTSVTFVASKKGTFEYYCSVGAHRANGMVGQLIVE